MLMASFRLAESYGFRTKNYDNYCGSAIYGDNPNGDSIGIIAHMDIVPEGNGWTHDPFDPYLSEDGKYLFGRGTADDKAPAMVGLYAMRFLKEHGIKLKKRCDAGIRPERGKRERRYAGIFKTGKSAEMVFGS